MARSFFGIEKILRLFRTNSNTVFADVLLATAAPGGDAGEQDAAPISSLCIVQDGANSKVYQKIANAGALADWKDITAGDVSIDQLSWRNEKVCFATNDTLTAGNIDPTTLSDNESGLSDDDCAVGQYVIGDADGSPALFEITAINQGGGSNEITIAAASQPIADNDTLLFRITFLTLEPHKKRKLLFTFQQPVLLLLN